MNSKNSLLIGRGIFIVIITVVLGLIIINEKGGEIFKSKIDTKIIEYLETNYQELLEKTNYEETTYKNKIFSKKIVSKENKNHYFYIQYKNKKITDTYKKDYEEGTTLLNYLNRKLEKEIKKKTNVECKVNPINKLNGYSDKVQEKLLKEDHLLELKYYYISKDIIISEDRKSVV